MKKKGNIAIAIISSSLLMMGCQESPNNTQEAATSGEITTNSIMGYVYTTTNGEGENQIIQLARFADGTLGNEKLYATGGKGGANSKDPVYGDYDAQGGLQIVDNYMLCVNTGDNTVSIFELDKKTGNLKKGEVVSSHGDKPVSIGFTKSNTEPGIYWVAVANQWGIPTALYDGDKYVELPNKEFFKQDLKKADSSDKNRNVALYKFNTKTGKLTFDKLLDTYTRYWGGPVQVTFSHSGKQVALTTWGIPHFLTPNPDPKFVKPSQVIVYDFNEGKTTNKRVFEEEGLIGAVGFNWGKLDNRLYVTFFNPIKEKDNQGLVEIEVTQTQLNKIKGYETGAPLDLDEACWSAISPDYKRFYAVSFGTNVITPFELNEDGGITKALPYESVANKDKEADLKDMYVSPDNKYAYCLGAFHTFAIKYFTINEQGLKYTGEYQIEATKADEGKTGKYNFQGFIGFDLK